MGQASKPLTIGSTVLGVADVARARAFWTAALGYAPRDAEPGDAAPDHTEPDDTFVVLVPLDGAGAQLSLMLSDTPPPPYPRVHLDLYATDQAAQISRLTGLGARVVEDWPGYTDDSDFVVLEDPDGNRFCVVDKSG